MNAKSSAKIRHWVLDMGGPACGSVINSMEDFLPAHHLPIWNVENGGTCHMATGPSPQEDVLLAWGPGKGHQKDKYYIIWYGPLIITHYWCSR